MKIAKITAMVGIIIMVMGTIFHLQGQSIVGPQSSFMYSNPEWIDYGLEILVIGVIVLVAGIVLMKKTSL